MGSSVPRKAASVDEIIAAIEAARDKIMAEEIKSLVKVGIPRQMAYQMVSTRFHQKGMADEAEGDFDSATREWDEIG